MPILAAAGLIAGGAALALPMFEATAVGIVDGAESVASALARGGGFARTAAREFATEYRAAAGKVTNVNLPIPKRWARLWVLKAGPRPKSCAEAPLSAPVLPAAHGPHARSPLRPKTLSPRDVRMCRSPDVRSDGLAGDAMTMRAECLGRRLGQWSWRATVAGIRMLFVAAVLAFIGHAIVPGMPAGAYLIVFCAANFISAPIKPIIRAARRARSACSPRAPRVQGSGFVRPSRVHPPL